MSQVFESWWGPTSANSGLESYLIGFHVHSRVSSPQIHSCRSKVSQYEPVLMWSAGDQRDLGRIRAGFIHPHFFQLLHNWLTHLALLQLINSFQNIKTSTRKAEKSKEFRMMVSLYCLRSCAIQGHRKKFKNFCTDFFGGTAAGRLDILISKPFCEEIHFIIDISALL